VQTARFKAAVRIAAVSWWRGLDGLPPRSSDFRLQAKGCSSRRDADEDGRFTVTSFACVTSQDCLLS
jgi:hypothetical protein